MLQSYIFVTERVERTYSCVFCLIIKLASINNSCSSWFVYSMSLWQTFVDRHLMGEVDQNVKLTAGAIIGQDYVVWAQSPDFPKVSQLGLLFDHLCCRTYVSILESFFFSSFLKEVHSRILESSLHLIFLNCVFLFVSSS